MVTLLDIHDRIYEGPVCKPSEWDLKIIPSKTKECLKNHGLINVYSPETLIPDDDGLADEVFNAAFDLAVELGMLCIDTCRVIKISEDELKDAIKNSPQEIWLGEGAEKVRVKKRIPEDKHEPVGFLGPFATPTSESLQIPIHASAFQYRVVEVGSPGKVMSVYGREIRGLNSPLELAWQRTNFERLRASTALVGRPGLALTVSSWSALGHLAPGTRKSDFHAISAISELKTSISLLCEVMTCAEIGATYYGYHHPILGGYVGGVEAAAVMRVASCLLLRAIYQPHAVQSHVIDIRNSSNCTKEAIWANAVAAQALSRNTPMLIYGDITPVSGPCTETLLYETSVPAIVETVCGSCMVLGVRSACGKYCDYVTGLESKFAGEVIKAASGMKRSDANEIIKKIISKYEKTLMNPPKGKSFLECFDLKTLKPSQEWLNIYNKVVKELMDLGLDIEGVTCKYSKNE